MRERIVLFVVVVLPFQGVRVLSKRWPAQQHHTLTGIAQRKHGGTSFEQYRARDTGVCLRTIILFN